MNAFGMYPRGADPRRSRTITWARVARAEEARRSERSSRLVRRADVPRRALRQLAGVSGAPLETTTRAARAR